MSFTSVIFFFAFFPAVLLMYYIITPRMKNGFMLLASLAFYSFGSYKTLLYLVASCVVNYLAGLLINELKERHNARKIVMGLTVTANIIGLCYFKYLASAFGLLNSFFGLQLNNASIVLPLGISFFTFRAVSYVLDIYMDKAPVSSNIINCALYITFFPQLVSGPITSYADFEPSLHPENRRMNLEKFVDGIWIFTIGMAKKVIISNNMATIVDFLFEIPGNERTVIFAWAGALGYLIQLYFDFSGYSDMAMGLSRMFGFSCAKNFDYPYASKSIGEFWRRWHITLGAWFRNYIYIPLGGNRKGTARTIFNMLVVWVITGIWHGAGLKFPVWGLLWFVFIAGERLVMRSKVPDTLIKSAIKHAYFVFVSLLIWVIFRADSLQASFDYIGSMFGMADNLFSNGTMEFIRRNWLVYLLGVVFSLPIVPWLKQRVEKIKVLDNIILIAQPFAAALLLIVSLSGIVAGTYNSFIYFRF